MQTTREDAQPPDDGRRPIRLAKTRRPTQTVWRHMADNDRPDEPNRDESGDDRGNQPPNPFEMLFGGSMGGPGGQPDFEAMMRQVQQMFGQLGAAGGGMFGPQSGGSAKSWETVRDLARKVVQTKGQDPTPTHASRRQLGDAARIVEGWLDRHVDLPATNGRIQAWSRAEWVENTMPTWRRLIDPVASALADAMGSLADSQGDADPQNPIAGLEAMIRPMLRQTGSTVFHAQAAEAIGNLASSVVSATESTLPLDGEHCHTVALLPTNVEEFADGLEQDANDIWLILTLRESARQRLFAAAPWLSERLLSLVERYAHGITIDTSGLEEAMGEFESMTDLSQLQEMSEKLQGNLFAPRRTPEQDRVLAELETLLALIDGWVDDVTADVTGQWMPSAAPIVESLRRRRASSGPTEATFQALVGLELRPRRVRDAENLWAALREDGGAQRREAAWGHPDLLPGPHDLDDPLGFVRPDVEGSDDTPSVDAFDEELRKLLESEGDDGASPRDGDER